MKNTIERMTHQEAHLLHEAVSFAKRHGKKDADGCRNVRMTYEAFGRKFGHIDGLRETIDRIEARYDRIGFFLMPGFVQISIYQGK